MARLSDIKSAIKDIIRGKYPEMTVFTYHPEVFDVPAAIITLSQSRKSNTYKALNKNKIVWDVEVYVLVERTEADMDGAELDAYVDLANPDSIANLLWEDETFGLDDVTSTVEGISGYGGEFAAAGDPHTGAVIRLEVTTQA